MSAATGGYTFAQKPRAVFNRPKYRPHADSKDANIMYNRRVIRGNTYAPVIVPDTTEEMIRPGSDQSSRRFARTRALARKRRQYARTLKKSSVDATALPSHEYLEDLPPPAKTSSLGLEEYGGAEEEDTVPFVPKARGVDVDTEVASTDLWDFDTSVEPVLQVLVGKCLDQGVVEVLQEERLKSAQRARQDFEQTRGLTLAGAQRLEMELQRCKEEVLRRIEQRKAKVDTDRMELRAQEAREHAKEYYNELQGKVMSRLFKAGHFYDPVSSQVESAFMPWVVEKVARQLQDVQRMRDSVDKVLDGAIGMGLQELADKEERERRAAEEEAERVRLEAEEKERVALELEKQRQQQELADRLAAEAAEVKATGEEPEGDEGDEVV